MSRVHSTCPHDCPSTCALEVEKLSNGQIGRIYGAKQNDYTAGVICAKVANYAERVQHPARLRHPLKRVGEKGIGKQAFVKISWEEALDEVADKLSETASRYGNESVWPYFYAGTMGLVQRDGIERLRHALGYSRQQSTICVTLADTGWIAGYGKKRGADPREIQDADLIVVWGGNPVNTQVNVMHHISQARRQRNAKLVVIDPYRTRTAAKADLHLMLRPGTDGALACAVMHELFANGDADREYLAKYTDAPAELEAHLATKTPAWAAAITGLSKAQIIEFAHLYGGTKRSFIRLGYGFTRSRNGAVNMHAAACLPVVSGAWQYRGGGALYGNTMLYGIDATLIQGLDMLDSKVRILDQSRIGPILCNDLQDLGDGPPVNALLIQNTNPMAVAPELNKVHQGFARSDLFVCVHEQFMTDTAAMADIVFPATTFLEHDDIYLASGHSYLQVANKIIEPYANSKSNHWLICELAKRLGAQHPGFTMNERELIAATLRASGWPGIEIFDSDHWHDCALDYESMHFLNGFEHQDQKFHFKANWSTYGAAGQEMPALPDHWDVIDNANPQKPFRLVTAPARQFLNTTFTEVETSRRLEKKPRVKIHPHDCQRLGIAAGQQVVIGNERGAVVVEVECFEGVLPGVIIVESIWPNRDFANGVGINALVSAERASPCGGAVFHDTAVWIKPA